MSRSPRIELDGAAFERVRSGSDLLLRSALLLSALGGCPSDPCEYAHDLRDADLRTAELSLQRDCGEAASCDLVDADALVSIAVGGIPCLRNGEAIDARLNDRSVVARGGGGERFSGGGHTLGSLGQGDDRCGCTDLWIHVPKLRFGTEQQIDLTLQGERDSLRMSWAVPEDFVRLEFPDGNPVPEGGRIMASVPSRSAGKLQITVKFVLDDGRLNPVPLPAPTIDATGRQVWTLPMLKSARVLPGPYAAEVEWERRSADCTSTGVRTCSLFARLAMTFQVYGGSP